MTRVADHPTGPRVQGRVGRRTPRAASGRGGPATAARGTRRWFETRMLPWLLLAPAALLVFGLVLFPVLRTLWLSVHEAGLASLVSGEMDFVALGNYVTVVTDPHLLGVFATTIVFGLLCVVGTMVVGLAVALLLNQRFPGRALLGVLVLLPWAVPRVAAAIVWRWMYNDQYGLVNWLFVGAGLDMFEGFAWFNDRVPAFLAIGVVVVWQSFPFVSLALLAGFQSISSEVIDAAKVDGAGAWQRLRYVTLPMLKPLLLVLVVISTIWDFKIFDQIYVMTGGGPARQTEVVAIATWREAFTQLDFGIASALAVTLFAVLAVVTLFYIRLVRRDDEELTA